MKKKVLLALLLSVFSAFSFGCTDQNSAKKPEEGGDVLSVGIIQISVHNALDAAREGFIKALADKGLKEGENLSISYENALGEMSNLSTISDKFVNDSADLVLAIGTPAAQSIASKTDSIPIVATAVTSFTDSGLVESDENPGANLTGASDMNPVAAQIDLLLELAPGAKTVGFLYNSGESNSVLQIDIAKERAMELGLEWEEATVTSTNDVQQAIQSLVSKCEAVYIPTDNTAASSMPAIGDAASEAKIPVVCGEINMTMEGGLASVGIDYEKLGYEAGLMAAEILQDGADPASMPVRYSTGDGVLVINGVMADAIELEIPDEYKEFVQCPEE